MAAYNPAGLVSHGFPFGIFTFTYALSGVAATDAAVAAAAGKAVSLDTTAPNTVKLAGDGDAIFGRVYVAENRDVLGIRVASVARKFKEKLTPSAAYLAATPAVGDRIVGAGGGLVKKATANAGAGVPSDPIVIEVGTDFVVAEYL